MGIAKTAFNTLLELSQDTDLGGTCVQIGRQSVSLDRAQVAECSKHWNKWNEAKQLLSSGLEIGDELIFKILGFDTVQSLDFSDYENPTYTHDLNTPLPELLKEKFDFVYDGGSSEHVFDFPQVLRNYHSMAKVGGIIAHAIPSTNHLDHGFYMFSPTLLWDYYLANKYKILRAYIIEYNYSSAVKGAKCQTWEYHPSKISNQFSGWRGNSVLLWFVVQKTPQSTCNVVPQQSAYRHMWGLESEQSATETNDLLPSYKHAGSKVNNSKNAPSPIIALARKLKITNIARRLRLKRILPPLLNRTESEADRASHNMREIGYF